MLAISSASFAQVYVANAGANSVLSYDALGVPTNVIASGGVNSPQGVTFDAAGNLYVGSPSNAVLKVTPTGVVSTFATTNINNPWGLAFDPVGNLYVGNYYAGTVTKYNSSGAYVSTFASGLGYVNGIAFDPSGNLFVARTGASAASPSIVKITPGGIQSTFTTSNLNDPKGLAFDAAGNLYVANSQGNNVYSFTTGATVSATQYLSGVASPYGIAFDSSGNLFVASYGGNSIWKFTGQDTGSVFATSGLHNPTGVAIAAIPEPSTYALLTATAGLAIAITRRLRRTG